MKPTRCSNFSNLFVYVIQLASRIRTELVPSWSCSQAVSKPVWHIPLLCVQWKTPDDGQRNCPKHVEFYSKNTFEKLRASSWFYYRNTVLDCICRHLFKGKVFCCILSFGWFLGVWILCADVSEHSVFIGRVNKKNDCCGKGRKYAYFIYFQLPSFPYDARSEGTKTRRKTGMGRNFIVVLSFLRKHILSKRWRFADRASQYIYPSI